MSYERVKEGELQVGRPVPWALYDQDDRLLLARGVVIESAHQLDELLARGLFRKLQLFEPAPAPQQAPSAQARPREEVHALDEIKLSIGDNLQLQSQAGNGGATRYYVKLIGFLRGKGVIVTTPMQDGKVLLMREGQAFVVRLFSGQSVYAFPATVFKVANVPYPHLHLTWPAQVKGLVVRRGARVKVSIIASAQDARGRSHAVTIDNLSTGGCSLVAKIPLGPRESKVHLKFRVLINGVEQFLHLDGIIRSVHGEAAEDGLTPQVQHGIQFTDLPPNEDVVLTAYVYQKLFEEAADA